MGQSASVTALGPIAQLGYVVDDVSAAMEHWIGALDVGPFFYLPSPPLNDLRYRGEPTDARIAVAITYSGDLQVELIQPLDDHPSPYRDFQARYGSGLHHLAHFTDDYDAALALYRQRGRTPYYEGRGLTPDQRFSYFDSPSHAGTVNEVVETSGFGGFFEHMREQSAGWDGTNPIRTIEF
ncbi:MAG: VOC family protein [Acidimicrobiales bacterium]|nr:VOC family protein [Acidimicrobiales bacterium]